MLERYRRSSTKGRGALREEFVGVTGTNRSSAAWLLRHHGMWLGRRTVVVGDAVPSVRRRRQRIYEAEVVEAVEGLWRLLDYASSKRLAAALPAVVQALKRHR